MISILLLTLFAQRVEFQPLTAGNQLVYGEFTIDIPSGTLYALEEDAHNMYPLLKFHEFKNGVGIFYDANANWDWAIGVQYIPDQIADTTIELPENTLDNFFLTQRHLHFLTPLSETNQSTIFLPPMMNDTLTSFEMGVHYSAGPEDNRGYFAKKVFMGSEGTLVLVARIVEVNFIDRIELVERVLNEAITVNLSDAAPDPEKVIPYPNFLGIEINLPGQSNKVKVDPERLEMLVSELARQREEELEVEPVNYWLLGGAVLLLGLAFGIKQIKSK